METTQSQTGAQPAQPQPPAKKPYERPAILYQAPLEAMADVCDPAVNGKASGICLVGES